MKMQINQLAAVVAIAHLTAAAPQITAIHTISWIPMNHDPTPVTTSASSSPTPPQSTISTIDWSALDLEPVSPSENDYLRNLPVDPSPVDDDEDIIPRGPPNDIDEVITANEDPEREDIESRELRDDKYFHLWPGMGASASTTATSEAVLEISSVYPTPPATETD